MASRYASWKDYPKRKSDDGQWLCRWCEEPLVGRRTSWCSTACRREVEVRCGHRVRRAVWLRDKGVCSRCGKDTNKAKRELRAFRGAALYAEIRRLGLTINEGLKSLWQAHHVKSVSEGGGACGVEGYATLCVWCHKDESAKLAKRRKGIRKNIVWRGKTT